MPHVRKTIIFAMFALLAGFLLSGCGEKDLNESQADTIAEPEALSVKVQSAENSKSVARDVEYPALVTSQRENTIIAKASGTAALVSFELGESVKAGKALVRIDATTGVQTNSDEKGFNDNQVEQAQLSVEQAEESLSLAKKNYNAIKDSKSATKSDRNAAKTQKDIAELQLKNARLALDSIIDDRLAIATISGIVTKKGISKGETVSIGQELAVIADPENIVVQFFVNEASLESIKTGAIVRVKDNSGNIASGVVSAVSLQADPATKRFLVEIKPEPEWETRLKLGSVAAVMLTEIQTTQKQGALILPLSAITIGQNESYVFVVNKGIAQKTLVTIERVSGETAEISADIPSNASIVIEGNKLIQDGDPVRIVS